MPDESKYSLMSIHEILNCLAEVHQGVCTDKGRVEIQDGEYTCVLISKEELYALEEALEILSNTSDVQNMARTIASITHAVAQGPLLAPTRTAAN
jgi:hypothetical protein